MAYTLDLRRLYRETEPVALDMPEDSFAQSSLVIEPPVHAPIGHNAGPPLEDDLSIPAFLRRTSLHWGMTEAIRQKPGKSSIDPGLVELSPMPIPQVLRKKYHKAFLALCELINECRRNGMGLDDAVPISLSAVAHVMCDAVYPQCDQDILRVFAAEIALARSGVDIASMPPAGTA
jgi:hypothetical protein